MLPNIYKGPIIKAGITFGLSCLLLKLAHNYYKSYNEPAKILLDPSSFANIDEVTTESYHLDLYIDFASKKLAGSIILNMKSFVNNLQIISLDCKLLNIKDVFYKGEKIPFKIEKVPNGQALGDKLVIELPEKQKKNSLFSFVIEYETISNISDSSALNWLEPSQTFDKKFPYFYTQSEPIYGRTIAPLQDTPSVKSAFSAKMKVDKGFNVFMSGNKTGDFSDEQYSYFNFKQDIRIPSYLLAIVAGDIILKAVSERTGVITEPSQIELCATELEHLDTYIKKIEGYLFEYVWGVYNIVVLPPSFPYGGMENPLLTFVNPSIITGDKSNIDVAIHEIAHSWSGNLVTCKTWTDFWLNEGLTVFLERKVVKELYGEKKYQLDAMLENMNLIAKIKSFGEDHNFTTLQPFFGDLKNPDDAFSIVPYEKGFQFLLYLEKAVGVESFRGFLRVFMRKFSYKSVDTNEFIQSFNDYFNQVMGKKQAAIILRKINWDDWLKKPGYPPQPLEFKVDDFDECKNLSEKFLNEEEFNQEIIEKYLSFDVNLKLIFLKNIYEKNGTLSEEKLKILQEKFQLDLEKNKEISFVWFKICVKNKFLENMKAVEEFLGSTGRMKFVNPLYEELYKVDPYLATQIFERKKMSYHPITREIVSKKLHLI